MQVFDFVTDKTVSIDDSTLRVEVRQRAGSFISLIGGHEYNYLVCADDDSHKKVFIELFSLPEDAFAYIDELKTAENHSDVGDQPGGDPGNE